MVSPSGATSSTATIRVSTGQTPITARAIKGGRSCRPPPLDGAVADLERTRRNPSYTFEDFQEVVVVGEAHVLGDLLDRFAHPQLEGGGLDARVEDFLVDASVEPSPEN